MNPARLYARLALEWLLVLTAACAMLSLLVAFQVTSRLDFMLYDLVQGRLHRDSDPSVLIVAIDNRSIAQEGEWPWPRDRMARLVDEIAKAEPKALGLDILLLGERDGPGDAALANAIGNAPTYLPVQFDVPGNDGAKFSMTPPIAPFADRATGLGHVNILPDRDGLIRRAYLSYTDGVASWPSLAVLMAGTAVGGTSAREVRPNENAMLVGQEPVLIGFAGPAGSYATVPAASVLRGELPPEFLRDRRVLVGVTASGVGDVYATPTGVDGSLMPGVEIQASLLDTLLTGRAVKPADTLNTLLFSLLPVIAFMVGLRILPPRWTLPLMVVLAAATLGTSLAALRTAQLWVPPASALVVIVLLYPAWTWRKLSLASRYLSQELERSAATSALLAREQTDDAPADVLDRQIHLLSRAVERERDLSKFLNDRLSQMPDCVIVTDVQGLTVFANQKAKLLFGELNGPGDLLYADDLLNYLHCLSPDGRSPLRFFAVSRLGGVPWNCAAETVGGQCFDVRFQPQRNSAHELVGYVIRIVDNTDIVTTQRQRNDALELLSHDMRAPQASLLSFVNGLGREAISPDAAARIRGYAGRTLKLADDFVHLARAQTVEVKVEPVDLLALATDAAETLWPLASAKNVEIEYDFAEPELEVSGDPSLLARMLGNLIDNAIKFSPRNSVVTLSGTTRQDGRRKWASIAIANDGEAIEPWRMAVLYERFQSSAPAGTYGVGLGLAFVHTVAVRHGGRIACQSIEGGRTTFTVELPAGVSPGAAPPLPTAG